MSRAFLKKCKFILKEALFLKNLGVLLDILGPLDVAVSGVGKVTNLKYKKNVLTCKDVDNCLEYRADVPSDPLLSEAEEDCKSVHYTYSGCASIDIAYYVSKKLVTAEKIRGDIKTGKEVTYNNGPYRNTCDNKNLLPALKRTYLGKLLVLIGVLLSVPVDEAYDINGKPEEEGGCHGSKAVRENKADKDLRDLNEYGNDEVPL